LRSSAGLEAGSAFVCPNFFGLWLVGLDFVEFVKSVRAYFAYRSRFLESLIGVIGRRLVA
jgi:hypothetical protein